MDDLAVARAYLAADQAVALEHDDLAARERQRPGNGQPDHAGADDDALDLLGHAASGGVGGGFGDWLTPCRRSSASRRTM